MIYRLDRFGRGGHHRPFNDLGFPGVRIMEAHENYDPPAPGPPHRGRRSSTATSIEGVNFDYAAKLTAVNAATLASAGLGSVPSRSSVLIGGAVQSLDAP